MDYRGLSDVVFLYLRSASRNVNACPIFKVAICITDVSFGSIDCTRGEAEGRTEWPLISGLDIRSCRSGVAKLQLRLPSVCIRAGGVPTGSCIRVPPHARQLGALSRGKGPGPDSTYRR